MADTKGEIQFIVHAKDPEMALGTDTINEHLSRAALNEFPVELTCLDGSTLSGTPRMGLVENENGYNIVMGIKDGAYKVPLPSGVHKLVAFLPNKKA